MKALITTVPFGARDDLPIELLKRNDISYVVNPLNKKLTEPELIELIPEFDIVIAGTEPITKSVIDSATNLKLISRVGIGLDSVDLNAAKERDIAVCYTPDAPAPAVAELTMGLMLTLLRSIHISNEQLHHEVWHRFFGRRLSECTIGIIGVGRIGRRVIQHLAGFNIQRILLNDTIENNDHTSQGNISWVSKETIYQDADILTLHLPLTPDTYNMIGKQELSMMKSDAIVINTSRGGIINESDLYNMLEAGHLSGAAIDVFEEEPYKGQLNKIERCVLTAHMGSMSVDCRTQMEIEATQEAIRFLKGEPLANPVPLEEYIIQQQR